MNQARRLGVERDLVCIIAKETGREKPLPRAAVYVSYRNVSFGGGGGQGSRGNRKVAKKEKWCPQQVQPRHPKRAINHKYG